MIRALAMTKRSGSDTRSEAPLVAARNKGLALLTGQIQCNSDPYSLALIGLAALDVEDKDLANIVADRLVPRSKSSDGGGVHWDLAAATAFNGWGTAGDIETSALAVEFLATLNRERDRALVDSGMSYLLKNKDRYGVWHSTQTTVNVLDALLAASVGDVAPEQTKQQSLSVVVNDETVSTIEIKPDDLGENVIDLTGKLTRGSNSIELRTNGPRLMAEVVSSHYVDWQDSEKAGSASKPTSMKLDYHCDRTVIKIMDEITCSIGAEKLGRSSYGMLLAEIGVPPGAEVNRESLEAALAADWRISHYEVLPDRIRIYLWSTPGGVKFVFKFRQRYRINALTPPSSVYDYYNPEAQAVVAPLRFVVE